VAKRVAAITGASSGIGMAFARKLASRYDLLLIGRRKDRLEALAGELTAQHECEVTVVAADLTDETALRAVAAGISGTANLALLVNNAGFGYRGAFWRADLAKIEEMHRLHVMATLKLSHAALRVLVANDHGAVINVASVAAFAQRAGSASYGATKSWLAAFTEGLYLDLRRAKSAVTVQALCPGFTYSGFHDVTAEDRHRLAPASWWLTAEHVVEASLRALDGGPIFVVPGWRYKLLLAILTKLPTRLKLRAEASRVSGP